MTVEEMLEKLEPSDMLRIMKDKKELYCGYLGMMEYHHGELSWIKIEVTKFRAVPEITHKRWKELGLMSPLKPSETPNFSFSDLQMKLYYTIYI